jgi:drug/metabolite transporter (DMT)-like permease
VRRATEAGAGALAVAGWRNLLAVGVLLPVLALRRVPRATAGSEPGSTVPAARFPWPEMLASGLLLAVHFAAWTASLGRTTVANASAIVAVQPAVTLLLGHVLLAERLTRRSGLLVGVAVLGAVVVTGADIAGAGDRLAGNGLAVLGTIAGAGYLLVGRRVRRHVALLPYVATVFAVCAAVLMAARLATGDGLGLPWAALGWIVALTVTGQLAGHVVFNVLLAHLPAWAVAITGAGEAVGATLLAWWLLAETPTAGFWLGAPLVLGAVMAAVAERGPAGRDRAPA